MNERAGALSIILKAKWTEFFITSHFIEVNGKTNAPGKKTAAMAAANDFI